jgi:hypothetical protein
LSQSFSFAFVPSDALYHTTENFQCGNDENLKNFIVFSNLVRCEAFCLYHSSVAEEKNFSSPVAELFLSLY